MRKYIIIIVLLILSISVKSQEPISFLDLEKRTTDYYFAAQWDSVITLGNMGLENGHDYFYLRVRLGVAYFNKTNYSKAIYHLEKARKMNPNDEFANSYLYLSYKYIGRSADAEVLGKTLSDSLRTEELFAKKPFFSGLYVEAGFSPANQSVPSKPKGSSDSIYTFSTNKVLTFGYIGLTNQITSWLSVHYGASALGTAVDLKIYDRMPPINTPKITDVLFVSQKQYYINPRIRLSKGLILTPYYHKVNITSIFENQRFYTDTTIYSSDWLVGAGLEKYYRNFVFLGEVSSNKFNEISHLQTQIGVTWLPFSNLNLYLNATLVSNGTRGQKELNNTATEKNKTFFSFKLGGKLSTKLWGETTLYSGNIQDSQVSNGFLFYNTPNAYRMLLNNSLIIVYSKVKLSIKHQYARLNGAIETKTSPVSTNNTSTNYIFNQQTITGGLLWNF